MQGAVARSLPNFRRSYLAKARALGKMRLDWWDLSALLGRTETEWAYGAGKRFIAAQFRSSDRFGDVAARASREGWITPELARARSAVPPAWSDSGVP